MPHLTSLALALLSAACAPHPTSQKLAIAAAADLNFALPEIARGFHAVDPAVELEIAYGSSGNFFAQIGNRAPFDVFLSADVEYPRRLAVGRYRACEFGIHVRSGTSRGVGAVRFSPRPGNRAAAIPE